jgi:TonB family protein
MYSGQKGVDKAVTAPERGLHLLVEPEPWLRIFLRNIADSFQPAAPPAWITARPGKYWADAVVHRPVSWTTFRQSVLGHILLVLFVYGLHLTWINQPQVLPDAPQTHAVLRYEVSEYLPPVNNNARPQTPQRLRPQKADPEHAPQEIVVINENRISTRQIVIQPNAQPKPVFLKQDIPLPNLIASTTVPGAPMATNHPLPVLPVNTPQVVPPAQPVAQSSLRPLAFPPMAQPDVAAPAGAAASRRTIQSLPMESAIVVPPAQDVMARKTNSLQIPVQAPPQVAAPSSEMSGRRTLQSISLPSNAPQVAPPASAATSRNLSKIGLPSQNATAVPPASPVINGSAAREKEVGLMLVLNAQPIAPSGPLTVPEGNRPGEFTASPAGHSGATARTEIREGKISSPANIYVAPPPTAVESKAAGNTVVASAAPPPVAHPLIPDRTDKPRDRIDAQVFGTRRNYSMRLSMPNLTSSTGSWSIHFAELKTVGHGESELSAPEAIRKVDPVYPQELVHDRVEGVVVLYAVIHADGTVGEVRVLEGFDERLNENARKALAQWRFRPGTKDGTAVDVEAVVRVPFKVPRNTF